MRLTSALIALRGDSKDSLVARNALSSLAARGFSILSSLMTVPIVLHHLGSERYGIWLVAMAISTLFTLADGGVVNGMLSLVAKAFGANDRAEIRRVFGSGLTLATLFGVLLLLVVFAVVQLVDWRWVFGTRSDALAKEAGWTVFAICVGYAVQFPIAAARHVRLGMLEGVAVNLWDLAGSLLGFIGLVIGLELNYGLIAVAIAWSLLPAIPKLIGTFFFLRGGALDLIPSRSDVHITVCKTLLASGSVFLFYGLTQALAVQSDQILIAQYLGLASVTQYSIVQRLFAQPPVLVALVVAAQWPSYAEAWGRGDRAWIRNHLLKSLFGVFGFSLLCALFLWYFCDKILYLWVGSAIQTTPYLVAGMVGYCVIGSIANLLTAFFLALRFHRRVVWMQLGMFCINLPVTIFLLPKIGNSGAIIGTTLGYVVAIVLPGIWLVRPLFLASATLPSLPFASGEQQSKIP